MRVAPLFYASKFVPNLNNDLEFMLDIRIAVRDVYALLIVCE